MKGKSEGKRKGKTERESEMGEGRKRKETRGGSLALRPVANNYYNI